ncbi:hypothetical protein RN001_014793 [Aquatica leii]|uniref:SHSP domain-containing protein n=1 Tax=Aquatica leii TaxID=1421715 RepID=A0AAN7PNU8_9COLE|nr:hypothetical protein RN001_014793 [Aquatica leii]
MLQFKLLNLLPEFDLNITPNPTACNRSMENKVDAILKKLEEMEVVQVRMEQKLDPLQAELDNLKKEHTKLTEENLKIKKYTIEQDERINLLEREIRKDKLIIQGIPDLENEVKMSLLPRIFREIERPLRMLEQQMRMAEEVFPYLERNYPSAFQLSNRHDSVTQDKEKFQLKIDVKNFTPEEISVKTTDENALIVEAKHESQDEKGSVSRHYIRQFLLPDGHDIKKVETKLSGDGMLTITAPNKVQPAIEETAIPVTHVESKK